MISLKRARVESLESRRLLSATISGVIYQDIGAVGSLQTGDPPLAGWTVFLDKNHDGILDNTEPSTVTDAAGRYTFSDVAAGTYDVREEPVTGFKPIPDAFKTVTVTDGQIFANLDLGNQKLIDFNYPGLTAAQDDSNPIDPSQRLPVTTANIPYSSIAISGKYIVTINGNSINTYRRIDGTLLTTQSLADFFALADTVAEGPTLLPNAANATNAQVVYDAGVGKFFVAAIANGSDGTSDILIAGSPRLAPNSGNWHYHSINVQDQNLTVQPLNSSLPTTPNQTASNLSLSFNGSSIYIAANIDDSSGSFFGSRLWIVPHGKAFALATTKLVDYVYDPSASVGLADLSNIDAANYSSKSIANVGVAYFVANADNLVDIIEVRQPGKKAIFSLKTLPAPADTSTTATPALQPDAAPAIDTSANAISAAWRKNFFWIADTLTPSTGADSGNSTVYWFELNIPTGSNANFTLLNSGSVSGSSISTSASTFAPAISIDRDQFVALSFSASGPSLDPSSYVVSRRTPDPLGTMRPAYSLNAGSSTYSATTNSAGLAEWGFSAMVLDPTTQERFWALGRAATDPSSIAGPWSQQIIGFEIPAKVFPVING